MANRYSVYEAGTDRPIYINGTSKECAKAMGITLSSFYTYRTRGAPHKFDIYIDEEDIDGEE